jgi:hypothetical protein
MKKKLQKAKFHFNDMNRAKEMWKNNMKERIGEMGIKRTIYEEWKLMVQP